MIDWKRGRQWLLAAGLGFAMAGCTVIPDAGGSSGGTNEPVSTAPAPTPEPSATQLPQDQQRHRIALLVPMTGSNAEIGSALANATTMALLDTNASNLRITTYDTATGAGTAAARAIADGNELILGPLMGDNVDAVIAQARPADVPLISFTNDMTKAARDVFVLGQRPGESVERTVRYARAQGSIRFAALVPDGEYGRRAELALRETLDDTGGQLVAVERYDRGNTSIVSAAGRLEMQGGFDTILIADSPRLSALAADAIGTRQILGTELWSGDSTVTRSSGLNGAWFSAVSDDRYRRFYDSYRQRFGSNPPRLATLGYDAVLLTLRVAQDWQPGRTFPRAELSNETGFIGLDGPFRFDRNGIGYRAMEVRQIGDGRVTVVSPAPSSFTD